MEAYVGLGAAAVTAFLVEAIYRARPALSRRYYALLAVAMGFFWNALALTSLGGDVARALPLGVLSGMAADKLRDFSKQRVGDRDDGEDE